MKTFEEIVKNPSVKGPILILLITLPIVFVGQYVSGTRFFFENPAPEGDLWTEKPSSAPTFSWNSNGNITFDGSDYMLGNYSISTSVTSNSSVWMRLSSIGSFNCSEEEYSRLSFRIKWVNEANVTPAAIVQLFSLNNESRRFELNVGDLVANSTNAWANASVNLNTEGWTQENSPNWANITGIEVLLEWTDPANLTLKLDDLFFGKFTSLSSSTTFSLQLVYSLMRNSVSFLLEWAILSGIVWLALKSFSGWKGFWRSLFSTVGYVYSTSIVYLAALAMLFFLLPPIFLPHNITYSEYLSIYQSSWGMPISLLTLLFYGWNTILCAVALKKMQELSWSKALLIGFGAIVISLLFSSLLLNAFL